VQDELFRAVRGMRTSKLEGKVALDAVTKLLANGADVNAVDGSGRGALSIAIGEAFSADSTPYTRKNSMLVVHTLLDAGADWNQKDQMGLSAVDYSRDLLEEAQTQMNAELSDKKKWVAVVLAHFLPVGADRYYAGRHELAACKLCGSALVYTFCLPSDNDIGSLMIRDPMSLYVAAGFSGCVAAPLLLDWVLLVFGRTKDDQGRYIATKAYKKRQPAYMHHETAAAIKEELRAREAKRRAAALAAAQGVSPDG
jgi:hypothetical protein